MAAQAELSLLPARRSYSRGRIHAPEVCAAVLVVGIGTAGLIAHSWPRQMVESWINIHLLFGLLLCGWVMIRYQWRVSQSPAMLPADARGLSRQLSHIVYCVLYGVLGLKLGIGIVSSLWHGGAVDFSLFDESLRHGPDTPVFNSPMTISNCFWRRAWCRSSLCVLMRYSGLWLRFLTEKSPG